MSRATELAVKLGMLSYADQGAASCVWTPGCNGVSQSDIEAFYHAARAEALREAEAVCRQEAERLGPNHHPERALDCAEAIRAMADREGK